MSASSTPTFPNIPEYVYLGPRTLVARLIDAAGPDFSDKAAAIDNCHAVFRICRDKPGHTFRWTTSCNSAFCRGCSLCRLSRLALAHHSHRERMKTMPAKRIYQLIWYFQVPRERGAIRRACATIARKLRKFSQGESYIAWWDAKTFIGPHLVIKGIYCGREGDYNFASLFPDAKVSVRARTSYDIDECFDEMLKPMLPKTDEERAELEIAFHGIQRFRTSSSGEYAQFTEEEKAKESVKSSRGGGSHDHKHGPRCQICGEPAVKMTAWMTREEMERILASGQEPPWMEKSPPGS